MRAADAALLIVALAIGWSFYRAHRSNDGTFANFNLLDLILENGRVSKLACVFMGAFTVSSWVMIRLTLDGKMTEGLFLGYGGVFVSPIIAKMFGLPAPVPSTTVTTISTDTKKTVKTK